MREVKYHLYLNDSEYGKIIESLIGLKNELAQQGKYTDAVDDLLCRFINAHKQKIRVIYS